MKIKQLPLIICTLIIVFIALYSLPLKKHIGLVVNGVQWKIDNENYSEKTSIAIKGTYNSYLLKKDTFNGNIIIDLYDFTNNSLPLNITFDDGIGNLIYVDKDNPSNTNSLGFLISTSNFDKLLIGVNTPVKSDSQMWSSENGLIISGTAENREEALELAKLLSQKSKWLSNGSFLK